MRARESARNRRELHSSGVVVGVKLGRCMGDPGTVWFPTRVASSPSDIQLCECLSVRAARGAGGAEAQMGTSRLGGCDSSSNFALFGLLGRARTHVATWAMFTQLFFPVLLLLPWLVFSFNVTASSLFVDKGSVSIGCR